MSLSLRQLLIEHRDAIVSRFVQQVLRKDLPPTPGLPRPVLIDHVPRFLDDIVNELASNEGPRYSHDVIDRSPAARQHGGQRWTLGYDLDALVREYGILRHAIMEAAKEAGADLSIDDFDVLAKCLNVGVAEACSEYGRFRDAQMRGQREEIEFLARAGQLLTSSLDYASTLARLTGLVVPTLADWCAVHVEGTSLVQTPIAHVNQAKVDAVRQALAHFASHPLSRGGYPEVMRTGVSELVEDASADLAATAEAPSSPQVSLFGETGARSWMIVPLRVQSTTFGAITLGMSESPRRYRPSDLPLVEELARRAAVAIDNANLYALSQKERARVEAATRAKDEFVAMVSHELRTPLNAILGWTRLLQSTSLSESSRSHAIEVIHRNATAQNQIVADLLDISRVITGKVRINPSQVDLGNIVDLVIEGMRPAMDAKRLTIETDIERTGAVMRGDGDRLQQVIWNLLANAVKFTPKGGTIRVKLDRAESDLQVVVADTGEGISADFLPHVFENFRQSDSSSARPHGGLGIGLSIAKHLVELHGGTITAASEGAGKGAAFIIRVPISPVVSTTLGLAKVPAARPPALIDPPPEELAGVTALVVDDDSDSRELLQFILERAGANVQTAKTAADATAAFDGSETHVVISDIGMPHGDGYSLIRDIRTHTSEGKRAVPAIALTAFARSEDRARALVEGFNVHMAKPVEPADLIDTVARLAGKPRTPSGPPPGS